MHCRYNTNAQQKRSLRTQAFAASEGVTGAPRCQSASPYEFVILAHRVFVRLHINKLTVPMEKVVNPKSELDRINRSTWNSHDAIREFTLDKTFTDPGEKAAFNWIAPRCTGLPLLDIGIGAGRTIGMMKAISADYTGIDYTQKLLDIARGRFPGTDLRHMDARDMSELPSDHYGLVMFSWNGIDAVDYPGRLQILKEMLRVAKPGGYVLFSSHNRDGPGYGENLWRLMPRFTFNPLKLGWRMLRTLKRLPAASFNYIRHTGLNRDYEGYSISAAAAHNFGLVIVYTTLREQLRQLAEVGFQTDAVFGSCEGDRLADGAQTSNAWWLHFVAHKPFPLSPGRHGGADVTEGIGQAPNL